MLKDFLSKLPIDVIRKIEIEEDKIFIPTKINSEEFYKKFSNEIEDADGLTDEKAIYLASIATPQPRKTISQLLVRGR